MTDEEVARISAYYNGSNDTITSLIAEVRRLHEALAMRTLAHEVDTDIQEEQIGEINDEATGLRDEVLRLQVENKRLLECTRERNEARQAMKQLYVYLLCTWICPNVSRRILNWMEENCPWLKEESLRAES